MLGIYTYGVATTKDGGRITTDSDNSNNWDICLGIVAVGGVGCHNQGWE